MNRQTKIGGNPEGKFYQGKVGTHSGRLIDLYDPDPDDFNIRDIALGLSNICRFNGQTRPGYSVAQHSVLVAQMFDGLLDPQLQLGALLHDAHEAYTGDIVRPIKGMPEISGQIREIEDRVTCAIFIRFGILEEVPVPFPETIKIADDIVLVQEALHLMLIGHTEWPQVRNAQKLRERAERIGLTRLPGPIDPWDAFTAEDKFLEEFIRIQQSLNQKVNK